MSSEFRKRKRSSEPGDINRREERCSRSRDHASSKKKTHGHRHDNEDRSPTTGEDSEAGSIDDSVGHYYGTQGTLIKERCKRFCYH